MSWQWLLRPLSLEEVLEQVRARSAEERLFLVEQALVGLDRARRRRALENAAYREPVEAQLALWRELGHWLEDASGTAATQRTSERSEAHEGEANPAAPLAGDTKQSRLRSLAISLHRLDAAGKLQLWEQLSHAVGAAIPARERYGELSGDLPRRARLPTDERDRLLLALEPEAVTDPRSVYYARARYRTLLRRFPRLAPGFDDALAAGLGLLELGPGEHAGVAALFAARGARVTVVDVEPLLEFGDVAYYQRLMTVMDSGGPYDWAVVLDFADGAVRFSERLEYRAPVPEATLPVPDGSLGAAYSGAALEHVRDLDALAAELFRALAPGAPMVHLLDLSDHRAGAEHGPLSHLCLGEEAWRAVDSDAGYFQSRRLARDYEQSFRRAGFERVSLEVIRRAEITDDLRARLDADFAGLDDAAIDPLDVIVTAVRP